MGLCDVTKGIDISPWLVTTLYLVVVLNLNHFTGIQQLKNWPPKTGRIMDQPQTLCANWLPVLHMYFFTSVIWEVCHHSDVIHVGLGGGVEQNRAMEARVVEEIKVDVLHKEAFGIPVGRSHATVKQTVRARRKPSRQDGALTKLTWWRR